MRSIRRHERLEGCISTSKDSSCSHGTHRFRFWRELCVKMQDGIVGVDDAGRFIFVDEEVLVSGNARLSNIL